MSDLFGNAGQYLKQYGLRIAFVACVIVLGILLTWLLTWILKKILHKTKIDDAAISFITALFKIVMAIIITLICASILDLSTSSLIVSLSTVALAIVVALKDSFANLANGVIIIGNKLFKRGDYVSINGIEGKVQSIKLLTVELVSFDNTKIVLPNSAVLTGNVLNYSAYPLRRVDVKCRVPYDADMDKVEKILKYLCSSEPLILKSIEPAIFMDSHGADSAIYIIRAWTNTTDYFTVKNAFPRRIYEAFKADGIRIPYSQIDVHIKNDSEVKGNE